MVSNSFCNSDNRLSGVILTILNFNVFEEVSANISTYFGNWYDNDSLESEAFIFCMAYMFTVGLPSASCFNCLIRVSRVFLKEAPK